MAEMTPMMKQYLEMKERNPDSILFFRLGDFYEMFNEDAKLVSKELDLTLTTRDRNKPPEERTPMCGVPYHSCDSYIARLIAKGYKVAICEQTEDPALAKGLVDRDIIRVITPGTVIASSMLEEGRNNFLCAVYADSAALGLCLCDISTGEVFATSFPSGEEALPHLENELGRFHPAEAVLSDGAWNLEGLTDFLREKLDCLCENGGEGRFRYDVSRTQVEGQFRGGWSPMRPKRPLPEGDRAAVQATGGLLSYLYETQKTDLSHIAVFTYYTAGQFMELDLTARQTLELTETMRGKEKKGDLSCGCWTRPAPLWATGSSGAHLYPPGGPDYADGPDRGLRSGGVRPHRPGGPHFLPRGGQRRPGARAVHLHGGWPRPS